MAQPWWCGYPGCKVTGECGNTEYGPCLPEDNDTREGRHDLTELQIATRQIEEELATRCGT